MSEIASNFQASGEGGSGGAGDHLLGGRRATGSEKYACLNSRVSPWTQRKNMPLRQKIKRPFLSKEYNNTLYIY